MKLLSLFLPLFFAANLTDTAIAKEAMPANYERALELIHAFSGAGNELQRAMELANALSQSHPKGGYSQALQAEMLSTWRLGQDGEPETLRIQIIQLADQALHLNPDLAQAHVAKGRALLRASKYDEASKTIDAALKIDPELTGAIFLRAEILRRTNRVSESESSYLKFIELTSSPTRKSNGYYWLGKLYQDAAWDQPTQWATLIPKARRAYEKMLEIDPDGAWKNVNFAIFLNNEAGDFIAAERYAQRALNIMEFPMARYHLAFARYQKLLAPMASMDNKALRDAVGQVFATTGVSFEDALRSTDQWVGISGRLKRINSRLQQTAK